MKRFITRKTYKIKYKIIIVFIILLIIMILIVYSIKKIDSKKYSRILLNNATNTTIDYVKILNLYSLLEPSSLIKNTISEYNEINIKDVIKENNELDKDTYQLFENKEPILYIYNTHQTEEYVSDTLSNYNITPTVYMLSNILKNELEKYNIYSVVEDKSIKDVLNENNWIYKDSYKASRILLNEAKTNYPSIKYFLDLHRDSVSDVIEINNIKYAKILFVLGMNHSNYEKNEELMLKMNNYLDTNYPGISKNILYAKKNIFNQDFDQNTFLIEVGGDKNTIEEAYNSVTLLSKAISEVIKNG